MIAKRVVAIAIFAHVVAVGLGLALVLAGCWPWPPRMDTGLVQWDFTPVDAGAPAEIVEVYVPASARSAGRRWTGSL